MDIIKICIFALSAIVLISILNQYNKSYAILASIISSVIVIFIAIDTLSPVVHYLMQLSSLTEGADFGCVLKSIGFGIITQTSADICEESGQKALANKVLLTGKIAIIFVCMPLFKTILSIIEGMLI